MEHDPIQTMFDEHTVICKTEGIVEGLSETWNNDSDLYEKILLHLVHFFREYADGYHHRKEEEVLFPAILNHPDFILGELIDEFEQHHEDFRDFTSNIERCLQNEDYEGSYTILKEYLQDLLDHIGAENDELFVLANSLLDEEELQKIYFKFKDIDLELGEENKTDLENRINNFS